jgi:hypothetical protein
MTTIAERSAQLQDQIETLRGDSNVSADAKLLSLTIESALLRIEDQLIDLEEATRSR